MMQALFFKATSDRAQARRFVDIAASLWMEAYAYPDGRDVASGISALGDRECIFWTLYVLQRQLHFGLSSFSGVSSRNLGLAFPEIVSPICPERGPVHNAKCREEPILYLVIFHISTV